jgi:hypothetical protein
VPSSDKHSEERSWRRLVWAVVAGLVLVLLPLGGGALGATSTGANGDIAYVNGTSIFLASAPSSAFVSGVDPSWSPDGTQLAFAADSSGTGQIKVCTVVTCGTGTPVGSATGTQPAWAPDASKIAYASGGSIHIVTYPAGADSPPLATGTDPSWNPDGTKLTYTSGGSVVTCTASSASACTSSLNTVATGSQPAWSPDGEWIVYQNGGSIFITAADGGGPTSAAIGTGTAPNWSPDGDKLVFVDATGTIEITEGSGTSWAIPTPRSDLLSGNSAPDWQSAVPVAAVAPSIFGTAQAGQLLTTDNGTWNGADPTRFPYTYQWKRCNSAGNNCNITVGTSSSYPPVSADVGSRIRLTVTASNEAGSTASSPSSATAAVTAAGSLSPPVNIVAPVVSLPTGETAPELGDVLFASPGTWTGSFPMTFAYSWTKCPAADPLDGPCVAIPGATLSFFTVPPALYGLRIRVRVTATNSAAVVAQSSAATDIVGATAPSLSVTPPIQGQNVVDQTLSVGTGTWLGSTPLTYTYEWRRCNPVGDLASCVPISLATKSTYVPTTADIGFSLRVYVTATNVTGSSTGITNHTFPVVDKQHFKPVPVDAPAIAGTLQIGRQLTGDAGSFNGDTPITTTLAWQRCDATGAACRTIPGATKVVYFLTVNDLGSTLRFVVTANNAYGTTVADSDPTEPVLGVPPHRRGRRIVGTNRADYLTGGGYDDVILGNGGNDTIFGGAGDDQLYGGPGNDVITGGAGADKIYGGPGSDTIYADDGERDIIDCGPGRDRAVVDSVDVVKNCEVTTIAGNSTGGTTGGGSPGSPGSP